MLKRYSTKEETAVWSDDSKYGAWLIVELAVLQARVIMGKIPKGIYERIVAQAKFTVERIEELDKKMKHDLLAFVMTVQEYLDGDLKKYFHEDITSYDTEEPAMALLIRQAMKIIFEELRALEIAVAEKALRYQYLIKIQRTHGQHAVPSTLGLENLWWYDALHRQEKFLKAADREIRHTKISGAVGTFEGNLSPELEQEALNILKLKPAPISMQIILRDRHAHVINALAVLAGVVENIALNIRLMGQTEIRELQEPFGKDQKGSSIMPHKKNTILSENLSGLARLLRSYATAALENIPTWSGRDISHSSVERVIFPDAFNLAHFMLRRTRGLIEGLVVNEKQIERNLNLTRGTIFSPDVKKMFLDHGYDPEAAYRIAQQGAFEASENDRNYLDVLCEREDVARDLVEPLRELFDFKKKVRYVDEVFNRFAKNPNMIRAKKNSRRKVKNKL